MWMFSLTRAANADHPAVASKRGHVSKEEICGPTGYQRSVTHMMTPFGKAHFAWETTDYFHLC